MCYIYIRAWGKMMGSDKHYIEEAVMEAIEDSAPKTAIFKESDGTWKTFKDIKRKDTRQIIQAIVAQMSPQPDDVSAETAP